MELGDPRRSQQPSGPPWPPSDPLRFEWTVALGRRRYLGEVRHEHLALPRKTASASSPEGGEATGGLRESLLSIGVDKKSAQKLLASRSLDKTVVPIYWKDGLVSHSGSLRLSKLPDFAKEFEKEFPDGELRWDTDYYEQDPEHNSSDVAVRVFFSYQEGDSGDHWSPKPTTMEEQAYQSMLKRCSYKGSDAVQASAALPA